MEDKDVVWGKPDLNEIRKYYATASTQVDPRSVFVQETLDSSIELDESFKIILEKRCRKPLVSGETIKQCAAIVENTAYKNNTDENECAWMNCGDDTFLKIEKLCEKTILEDSIDEGRKALTDITQLNDIEAPSFLFEQTTLNTTHFPKHSPINLVNLERPSTILEESTFYDSTKDELESTSINISEEKCTSLDASESFKTAQNQTFTNVSHLKEVMYSGTKENDKINITDKTIDLPNSSKSTSTDNTSINDNIECLDFNDTLEEMDFIMKHGMKFIEKRQAISKTESFQDIQPRVKPISFFATLECQSKKVETNSQFKKPMVKHNTKKFDHIASPIHAYIRDAPQYPLVTKQKGRSGLIEQLHDPTRRDTVYHNKDLFSKNISYEPPIPSKGVISAAKAQFFDARTPVKMPGGEKILKLIRPTPTVIKHQGRYKSYTNVQINANNTIDDSSQNLSMASADVSIKVLKNVNRL